MKTSIYTVYCQLKEEESNVFAKLKAKLHPNLKKESLYNIEINDEKINKEISQLILKTQQNITTFKTEIDHNEQLLREDELKELYTNMSFIQNKVKLLVQDIQKITELKLHHEQFFVIKDSSYLQDKAEQLQIMNQEIEEFLTIVEQQPSLRDLRNNLFVKLVQQLNSIVIATNKIITDDYYLREIYKQLEQT